MITRVLGERGEVLHDCIELGCTVSWDGYAIKDLAPEQLHDARAAIPVDATGVKMGERVPGATEVDQTRWKVAGKTAKLISTQG